MKLPDDFERQAIVLTFCVIMAMSFAVLLYGLFDPKVDNNRIFAIVGEDLRLALVALTGFVGGSAAKKNGP